MAQQVKNPPAMQETQEMQVWILGREDPLEEEMATHSSLLAYKIPRTEEPGGLQSMGLQCPTWLSDLSAWYIKKQSRIRCVCVCVCASELFIVAKKPTEAGLMAVV